MLKKIFIGLGITAAVVVIGLIIAARMLSGKVEPLIRAQVIEYLEKRFDSDVELGSLKVSMNMNSPVRVLLRAGKGVQAHVTGHDIKLWHKRRHDVPPLIKLDKFTFQVELNSLLAKPYRAEMLKVEGLHITVPPRPKAPVWKDVKDLRAAKDVQPKEVKEQSPQPGQQIWVIVDTVVCDGTKLTITPRDANKDPLEFDIRKLRLTSAGPGVAMTYDAELTNPKPPGLIYSKGHFGPWVTDEPSSTDLDGVYDFQNADLGVFKGIAGKLNSTGKFDGQIDHIVADGETRTSDFRLTMAGNPMNLRTTYHAVIDGGNGNTLLEPVEATLGRTRFSVRGGVVRNKGEAGKTVSLDVKFREGHMEDLLRLSMKGPVMLKGPVDLKVKMILPPGKGEVADKLQLVGSFVLHEGDFTSPTLQEKLDSMSSKAQGRPQDPSIKEVHTQMAGDFKMAHGVIEFPTLGVRIPGADLDLVGKYTFDQQEVDFRGKLRLEAKLSQTQTGWKRWVLKPADRFFAKEGAGMLVRIKIEGTRDAPKFSRDKDKADPTERSGPSAVSQLRD